MFEVNTVTTYTAGTDTPLVGGESGYVKVVKALYLTNLTEESIHVDLKQDGAVLARLIVSPNDTVEVQSTIAVPEGSAITFNADKDGLNVVVYTAKINQNAIASLL